MIIKSMSRKQPSFEQLYDYIVRDNDNDVKYNFTHNCFGTNREEILEEFTQNAELLSRRKGGNYLYHEVISITRSKQLSEKQQKAILRDLVQRYIRSRANDCLVFAGLHDEKQNQLHYHLMVSANMADDKKRYRLSKSQFDEAKRNVELYTLERYPELEQKKLINKDKTEKKNSNKEAELKRRTKKASQKDIMREKLSDIFRQSNSQAEYIKRLREANIETYIRGNAVGFINSESGRKHRLATLGLSEEFDEMEYTFTEKKEQKESKEQEQEKADKKPENKEQKKTKRQEIAEKRKAEFTAKTANKNKSGSDNSGRGRKK